MEFSSDEQKVVKPLAADQKKQLSGLEVQEEETSLENKDAHAHTHTHTHTAQNHLMFPLITGEL